MEIGILTDTRGQAVFLDTPGMEKPRHELGACMSATVRSAASESDLVLLLVEAGGWRPDDDDALAAAASSRKGVILCLTKTDLVRKKETILPVIQSSAQKHAFLDIIPVSAVTGDNLDALSDAIFRFLPEGQPLFPEEAVDAMSEEYRIAEIIREKVFAATYQEVPQATAVEVRSMRPGDTQPDVLVVEAAIIVDRAHLKGMLIGKGGAKIRSIGRRAREEIELLTRRKVFLDLTVDVIEDWRDRPDVFRRFGYGSP